MIERERWSHLSHPLHLWCFDRLSLEAILATHGFDILWVRFRNPWQTYRQLWLDRLRDGGLQGALAFFIRLVAYRMSHKEGGDILNVVAVKSDDHGHQG